MNYGIFWDEYRSVKQSHSSKVPSTPDYEDGSDRKDGKVVLICFFFQYKLLIMSHTRFRMNPHSVVP